MSSPIPSARLIAFLVEAKRNTYAAGVDSASVPPALPGSHQLEYRQGDFLYRDVYFGGGYFLGQETVYYGSTPIWGMVYAGGVLQGATVEPELVYVFLQRALRQVEAPRPFRGPSLYEQGAFEYTDASVGDIGTFFGTEIVSYQGKMVYQLRYGGVCSVDFGWV